MLEKLKGFLRVKEAAELLASCSCITPYRKGVVVRRMALSANMSETLTPLEFSVEGGEV